MTRASLLLATRNPGKLRELQPLFERAGFPIVDLETFGLPEDDDEHDLESFPTFEENALAKARHFYEVSGGMATVADDSGLEVPSLGGAPGVRSKRYSGAALAGPRLDDANNAALLAALRHAPAGHSDRRARFVCAAAWVGLGTEIVRRGETEGEIIAEPRGRLGFGYDPYFLASDLGRTLAEADVAEKEAVSHRGRAFHALIAALREVQ